MAEPNSSPTPPATRTSTSPKKDDLRPMGLKISELNESQSELRSRLQSLKQDLQDWKSKLDTQVKTYKEELTDLKKALSTDLDKLKSDFQELRTTLQQQQEDITDSLKNLTIVDISETFEEAEAKDSPHVSNKTEEASLPENADETSAVDGAVEIAVN